MNAAAAAVAGRADLPTALCYDSSAILLEEKWKGSR